jgi:hypothetical protein
MQEPVAKREGSEAVLARIVLTAFAALGAQGQEQPHEAPFPLETLRARLHGQPAAERARLERHLEELQRLSPEERAELLRRARVLRERERALDARLPSDERRRLDRLRPEERRALHHLRLRQEILERGRELRARIPAALRSRLEQAPPELRRRVLERVLEERAGEELRALRGKLERLAPQEFERLRRLPRGERRQALRDLRHHRPDR